jgi:hypothetical protein
MMLFITSSSFGKQLAAAPLSPFLMPRSKHLVFISKMPCPFSIRASAKDWLHCGEVAVLCLFTD